ncbi:MAG: phosphonate ABC transporter permease, partial [Chloroflexi bacterium]
METTLPSGRIRVRPRSHANTVLQATLIVLALLTVYGLITIDTRNINVVTAFGDMLNNFRVVLFEARLKNLSWLDLFRELMITVALGLLTTVFGAIIAFFLALLAAQNLAPRRVN